MLKLLIITPNSLTQTDRHVENIMWCIQMILRKPVFNYIEHAVFMHLSLALLCQLICHFY